MPCTKWQLAIFRFTHASELTSNNPNTPHIECYTAYSETQ